ncbi:unnamed protein product [Blepharisma stoltei]|uniref:PCI domain-containing protein n=1 Tax=Blepharisma stoltei TaxID=1481888 RepID=A0AAU9J6C7_9CILI|nr:unnamed protein product [Blepharisma stoltei]
MSKIRSIQANPTQEEELRKAEVEKGDLPSALSALYTRLSEAEQNFSDIDIRDTLIEIGDYFQAEGNFDRAINIYLIAYDKAGASDIKIDITLKIALIGFKTKNLDMLKKEIEQATALFEEGGDWERKNRFKAYEAVYFMMIRNFKQAAHNFLDILATFTSTELISFQDFIQYTILMSLVSLDRATIRTKVIHAPEILSVIREMPTIQQFLDSLYKCNYKQFIKSFVDVIDLVANDNYISQHKRYWAREMRVVAYSQFLESYRSVTLESMAKSFGVSIDFLDKELCEFISSGRLPCKIDRVNGVIESNRPDSRSAVYGSIVKSGDYILNRLQKLARIMDV